MKNIMFIKRSDSNINGHLISTPTEIFDRKRFQLTSRELIATLLSHKKGDVYKLIDVRNRLYRNFSDRSLVKAIKTLVREKYLTLLHSDNKCEIYIIECPPLGKSILDELGINPENYEK